MKILLPGIVKAYQAERLRVEGEKRGHTVEGCYAQELVLRVDNAAFVPEVFGKKLSEYDLMCLYVGKRRWEWYLAAYYLSKIYGTVVVNNCVVSPTPYSYLSPAASYLKQTETGLPFPKSAVLYSVGAFDFVSADFSYPFVVKPAWARKGKGVELVRNRKEFEAAARAAMIANPASPAYVVREYIPNDGDLRIFTVGYKAIAAMRRIPHPGDFRSNISQGGRGELFDLSLNPEIVGVAERLSSEMKIEIAGVDIIIHRETGKPYILEINPSPQFEGLEKYTGVNAAGAIIKYFESLI